MAVSHRLPVQTSGRQSEPEPLSVTGEPSNSSPLQDGNASSSGNAISGKLRELAADIINEALRDAHSDIRVDHRSFKDRGLDREPTTHLGPAASEMERRGEPTERGDINREAAQNNELIAERETLTEAIAIEQDRISRPPRDYQEARERVKDDVAPLREAIQQRGAVADIQSTDGLKWWQRAARSITEKAKALALAISEKARSFWQSRAPEPERTPDRGRDPDGGFDR